MTFECTACHMRYRIDDSIVPRGGARVRCRQCSTVILIPAPAVVPRPANLDLIPPTPSRPRPAPQVPAPANAPDWLAADLTPEAPEPARPAPPAARPPAPAAPPPPAREFPEPPVSVPSEPVGGMAVVGESQDVETFERFAPPAAPPSGGRDPAFEDIGISVARFETGPVPPTPGPEPVAPAPEYPRLETESFAVPMTQASPPPSVPQSPLEPPPQPSPRAPVSAPAAPHSAPAAARTFTAPAESGSGQGGGNVVPLTMGTPIPEGLTPEERARHEKARRLARVLASDIAIYNREKKDRGIQEGNLVAVLGYEIKKSWETYKERVGAEFANSTPYFRDALNDMLAEGKKIF